MYVLAKQAYGRERYYSIIRQGTTERAVWVESLELAERFPNEATARDAMTSSMRGAYCMPEMTARV